MRALRQIIRIRSSLAGNDHDGDVRPPASGLAWAGEAVAAAGHMHVGERKHGAPMKLGQDGEGRFAWAASTVANPASSGLSAALMRIRSSSSTTRTQGGVC